MMYNEFVDQVVSSVRNEVDERTSVVVKPIRRNNDFSSDGLNIVRDENIFTPTVFLDECYEDYLKGKPIGGIVSDITDFYNSHNQSGSIDISYFYDFSGVESHLAYKLINYEKNIELLNEVPHERFLDFAIVYYCLIKHSVFGTGSILIKNDHLAYWDIDKNRLFEAGKKNAPVIQPLRIVMAGEALENAGVELEECPLMYMITNENSYYGAACMHYPGALEKIADIFENDLYILPSSVDEVLAIEKSKVYHPETLRKMVQDINEHYVSKESFLSDNIYIYVRDTQTIKIY